MHREEHASLDKKQKQKDDNVGGGGSGGTSQVSKLKRKFANQKYQIAALHKKTKVGGNKLSDSDSDGEEEGTSNRRNPALIRQNNKKKKVKVG